MLGTGNPYASDDPTTEPSWFPASASLINPYFLPVSQGGLGFWQPWFILRNFSSPVNTPCVGS